MEIIKLKGEDEQLYQLVAHLVMNEKVLNYNLNYPFRTSPDHRWFLAADDGNILGFVPVKTEAGKAKINNYYVVNDNSEVFAALLKEIAGAFPADCGVEAIVQVRHVPEFEQNGFAVLFLWKRYAKMKVFKKNEKKNARKEG
jgi:hypothetical protein